MQMVQSRSAPEDYGDTILLKFILSIHETIKASWRLSQTLPFGKNTDVINVLSFFLVTC